MSDEAKKAIQGSSLFEKEADFGPLSLYRYKDCQSLYVDLPKVRPVLYAGKNWVGDFFQWYKAADRLDNRSTISVTVEGEDEGDEPAQEEEGPDQVRADALPVGLEAGHPAGDEPEGQEPQQKRDRKR